MKLDELDHELTRLKEASERIAANLVELEIDSSRQLLETSALSGTSATRWAQASAALACLWEWRALLDGLLERAEKLRRKWRLNELRLLLTSPSIELTGSPVPLAERDLLGSAESTTRCTPNQLIARMSTAFDEAKTVLAEFGAAWETLTPRLAHARADLEEAQKRAAPLGEPEQSDLEDAAQRLDRLTATLSSDPLSVAPAEVDRLLDSLAAIQRELEATAGLRDELGARLADARALLADLQALVRDAHAAHEELLVKISAPSAPPAPELPDELGAELERIAQLGRSGAWREARKDLDRFTARAAGLRDEAVRISRANRAPLEARNQFRALLEAYQVKAGRVGAIEDPELERIFAEAHAALYTAPTDLARAVQLVRRYQAMVSAPRPEREVLR